MLKKLSEYDKRLKLKQFNFEDVCEIYNNIISKYINNTRLSRVLHVLGGAHLSTMLFNYEDVSGLFNKLVKQYDSQLITINQDEFKVVINDKYNCFITLTTRDKNEYKFLISDSFVLLYIGETKCELVIHIDGDNDVIIVPKKLNDSNIQYVTGVSVKEYLGKYSKYIDGKDIDDIKTQINFLTTESILHKLSDLFNTILETEIKNKNIAKITNENIANSFCDLKTIMDKHELSAKTSNGRYLVSKTENEVLDNLKKGVENFMMLNELVVFGADGRGDYVVDFGSNDCRVAVKLGLGNFEVTLSSYKDKVHFNTYKSKNDVNFALIRYFSTDMLYLLLIKGKNVKDLVDLHDKFMTSKNEFRMKHDIGVIVKFYQDTNNNGYTVIYDTLSDNILMIYYENSIFGDLNNVIQYVSKPPIGENDFNDIDEMLAQMPKQKYAKYKHKYLALKNRLTM